MTDNQQEKTEKISLPNGEELDITIKIQPQSTPVDQATNQSAPVLQNMPPQVANNPTIPNAQQSMGAMPFMVPEKSTGAIKIVLFLLVGIGIVMFFIYKQTTTGGGQAMIKQMDGTEVSTPQTVSSDGKTSVVSIPPIQTTPTTPIQEVKKIRR